MRQSSVIKGQILISQHKQMLRPQNGIIPAEHQPPSQKQKAEGGYGEHDEVFGEDIHRILRPRKPRFYRCKTEIHKKDQNRGEQHPQCIDDHSRTHIFLPPFLNMTGTFISSYHTKNAHPSDARPRDLFSSLLSPLRDMMWEIPYATDGPRSGASDR